MFLVEAKGPEKELFPQIYKQVSKILWADRTQGQAVNVPPVVKKLKDKASVPHKKQ